MFQENQSYPSYFNGSAFPIESLDMLSVVKNSFNWIFINQIDCSFKWIQSTYVKNKITDHQSGPLGPPYSALDLYFCSFSSVSIQPVASLLEGLLTIILPQEKILSEFWTSTSFPLLLPTLIWQSVCSFLSLMFKDFLQITE